MSVKKTSRPERTEPVDDWFTMTRSAWRVDEDGNRYAPGDGCPDDDEHFDASEITHEVPSDLVRSFGTKLVKAMYAIYPCDGCGMPMLYLVLEDEQFNRYHLPMTPNMGPVFSAMTGAAVEMAKDEDRKYEETPEPHTDLVDAAFDLLKAIVQTTDELGIASGTTLQNVETGESIDLSDVLRSSETVADFRQGVRDAIRMHVSGAPPLSAKDWTLDIPQA